MDRSNLGDQAEGAFLNYRSPDDNRKFDELYNVQWLTTNTIKDSSSVVITTIQRLYSMLQGRRASSSASSCAASSGASRFPTASSLRRERHRQRSSYPPATRCSAEADSAPGSVGLRGAHEADKS